MHIIVRVVLGASIRLGVSFVYKHSILKTYLLNKGIFFYFYCLIDKVPKSNLAIGHGFDLKLVSSWELFEMEHQKAHKDLHIKCMLIRWECSVL